MSITWNAFYSVARSYLGRDPAIQSWERGRALFWAHLCASAKTDQLYQGFVQDEIPLVRNRLSAVVGTKVLKTNYTGVLAEPSARLLYTPSATQTIWAAYTHALRTPADVERDFNLSSFLGDASNGLPIFARFSANPAFRSEQLNGYELGYRGLAGSRFSVDIDGFYNHYGDLFSEDLIALDVIETNPPPTHLLISAQFGNGLVAEHNRNGTRA